MAAWCRPGVHRAAVRVASRQPRLLPAGVLPEVGAGEYYARGYGTYLRYCSVHSHDRRYHIPIPI
jgi:hypothetical protein